MTKNVTVIRYNKNIHETDAKLVEMLERYRHVNLSDKSMWANTSFVFARQLYNMLQLARVIAQGAAHARRVARRALQAGLPGARRRQLVEDDEGVLCADADEPRFEFEPVDTSLIKPRPRRYDAAT